MNHQQAYSLIQCKIMYSNWISSFPCRPGWSWMQTRYLQEHFLTCSIWSLMPFPFNTVLLFMINKSWWFHLDNGQIRGKPACKCRRNLTQSVGNMPPPSPRHLLLYVLQIMPNKPQIWPISAKGSPSWGKSTEHDQNAWKPQIWPISLSQNSIKLEKTINCNHNLISSESGQDTSVCMQNFRPIPQWVFQKMLGNPKFDLFHIVKIPPKLINHQTVTII